MRLKIRDGIYLNELERLGFRKCGDYYSYVFDDLNEIIIDEPTRIIEIDGDISIYNVDAYNIVLFDLIKLGIVEKI